MFGFSHLPFSTLYTPLFNGEIESFSMYIEQGLGYDFDINLDQDFTIDVNGYLNSNLYIDTEEDLVLTIQRFPGAIL